MLMHGKLGKRLEVGSKGVEAGSRLGLCFGTSKPDPDYR